MNAPCRLSLAVLALLSHGAGAAEVFTLTSPAFTDNGMLDPSNAGNAKGNPNCTGQNVAPPLAWANAPAGTRSLVLLIYDPQGGNGLGVSHQVAYGIAPGITGFAQGELADPAKGFVGGKSSPGATVYYGPCPAPGTGLHHYVFSIIATDLEPDAMEPGLTRQQVLDRLAGHAKATAAIVGRFGQ